MINLIPTDVKYARIYGRRNRILSGYSLGVIVIGLLAVSVLLFNMQNVKSSEASMREEIKKQEEIAAKLEKSQKEVDKLADQITTVYKLYAGEVKFSELIPKIGSLMPSGAVMNSLSLAGGRTSPLQLDVDIEEPQLAAVVQQNLVNSDLFGAVDISSIVSKGTGTAKPGQKYYSYGATLTATFKGVVAVKKQASVPIGGNR